MEVYESFLFMKNFGKFMFGKTIQFMISASDLSECYFQKNFCHDFVFTFFGNFSIGPTMILICFPLRTLKYIRYMRTGQLFVDRIAANFPNKPLLMRSRTAEDHESLQNHKFLHRMRLRWLKNITRKILLQMA